ncbi:MAG: YceI family protein [Nitrosomonadales bacterium]|nr:YceI family protein [Nitrosomonadales bacterium]
MMRWILLLLVCATAPASAAEDCFTSDTAGSGVTFRVMQAGAPYTGNFRRFSGVVCFSQGRLTRIDASLDPASVDTGLPELDAALKESDFFDVRKFPRVTFVSTAVQSQGAAHTTRGTLEIKGNRREVEIVLHTRPAGGKTAISGSFTLDRLQYNIGTGDWSNTKWLGAEVKLDISAILTRGK